MRFRTADFFMRLSLVKRFTLVSLIVELSGMVGTGAWVERRIKSGVMHRVAATTALYVDGFVAPNRAGACPLRLTCR